MNTKTNNQNTNANSIYEYLLAAMLGQAINDLIDLYSGKRIPGENIDSTERWLYEAHDMGLIDCNPNRVIKLCKEQAATA